MHPNVGMSARAVRGGAIAAGMSMGALAIGAAFAKVASDHDGAVDVIAKGVAGTGFVVGGIWSLGTIAAPAVAYANPIDYPVPFQFPAPRTPIGTRFLAAGSAAAGIVGAVWAANEISKRID